MKNNLGKIFKFSVLALFLAYTFLPFGFVEKAKADCSFTIDWKEDKNTTSATLNQQLNFTATVKESGDTSCPNSATIFVVSDKAFSIPSKNVSFANFTAIANFSFKPSDLLPSGGNTLNVKAKVGTGILSTQVTESSFWTVNITGASTGSRGMTISLQPANSLFQAGSSFGIFASIDNNLYNEINSKGVAQVYFKVLINKNEFDGNTVPLSNFSGNTPVKYGEVDVNDENGFINGPNTINLELWAAGTSAKLGSASTNINAQGLKSSAPPTSSTKKYACKDGNGVYQCSKDNKKDLSDVTVKTGDCQYDYTSPDTGPAEEVDASYCGKTDAQINAGKGGGGGTSATDHLMNPLPTQGLLETFLTITKGFLAGLALWAVVAIIFAGFRMVVAAGNEEDLAVAKRSITWAILGLLAALLSFSIVAIVQSIFGVKIENFNPNPTTGNRIEQTYEKNNKNI